MLIGKWDFVVAKLHARLELLLTVMGVGVHLQLSKHARPFALRFVAQALVVAARWGILRCPRSRTLNFPLKNQKSSLMPSNYKIVKLEVVRGYEVRPPLFRGNEGI